MKSQLLSYVTTEWSKSEIKITILFITAHKNEIIFITDQSPRNSHGSQHMKHIFVRWMRKSIFTVSVHWSSISQFLLPASLVFMSSEFLIYLGYWLFSKLFLRLPLLHSFSLTILLILMIPIKYFSDQLFSTWAISLLLWKGSCSLPTMGWLISSHHIEYHLQY